MGVLLAAQFPDLPGLRPETDVTTGATLPPEAADDFTHEVVADLPGLARTLERVRRLEEVSLDCEATSPDPADPDLGKNPLRATPLTVQVGDAHHSDVVVLHRFEPRQLQLLWQLLPGRTVVGHNLNYDYRLLRKNYKIPPWRAVYDTQLAEQLLTQGHFDAKKDWLKQVSLAATARRHLGIALDKEVRESFIAVRPEDIANWLPTAAQARYAAKDTIVTQRVADVQIDALLEQDLLRALRARLGALVPIAEVELRGMRIDVDGWREFLKGIEVELAEVERELLSRLDPFEQRWRIRDLQRQVADKQLWEQAKAAEEERLRQVWQTLSTSATATSSTTSPPPAPPPPPPPTPTPISPPAMSSSSMSPDIISTSPSRWPIPASSTSPAGGSSSTTAPASGASPTPTWGRFKQQGMAKWRSIHPNPGKPGVDEGPINLNSDTQIKRAYTAMGVKLPLKKDPKTGVMKAVCDAKAREKLLRSGSLSPTQRQVLELHGLYSKLSKLLGSFGENLLARLTPSGRLHTNYNIGLTETGRMSSENPNFQNFPRRNELRHCFLADPGHVIVTADYSGQELNIAAGLSHDPKMSGDLLAGKDLYKELAVDVGLAPDVAHVTKDQRQITKAALLGVCYGLTAKGMEAQKQIPAALAQRAIDAIKAKYPTFFAFAEENARLALTRRYVTTALGARRYFPDTSAPVWKIENEGRNAPIQGTAADIVYTLAARLERRVRDGLVPFNYVHDEAVVQVRAERAAWGQAEVVREMQAAFEDVMPFAVYGVRCEVEATVAPYWTK